MHTSTVSLADLNNDGLVDIVIGNYDGTVNHILWNSISGGFSSSTSLPGNLGSKSIAVTDVNNDGFVDIVFGNMLDKNQLLIPTWRKHRHKLYCFCRYQWRYIPGYHYRELWD